MVAEMTGSYDAPDWTVLGEVRMGATEMHLFDVLNRVKPTKRCLSRLFTVKSRFLTMVNDKDHKYSEFESVFNRSFNIYILVLRIISSVMGLGN